MKPPPARQQAGVGRLSDHPARWPDAHHQRVRLGLPYKVNRASPPGLFHVDVSDSREYGSALIGPAIRLHQPPMTRPVPVQPYGRTAAATREEPDRDDDGQQCSTRVHLLQARPERVTLGHGGAVNTNRWRDHHRRRTQGGGGWPGVRYLYQYYNRLRRRQSKLSSFFFSSRTRVSEYW